MEYTAFNHRMSVPMLHSVPLKWFGRISIIASLFERGMVDCCRLANVTSVALVGLDAYLVDVKVDITDGLPQFSRRRFPRRDGEGRP